MREAVCADKARFDHPFNICARFVRLDERRECRCIRGDHEILGEPAFEAEARNAEGTVLVVERGIDGVVGAFGDSTRNVATPPIAELGLDLVAARPLQARGGEGGPCPAGAGRQRRPAPLTLGHLAHLAAMRAKAALQTLGSPDLSPGTLSRAGKGDGDGGAQGTVSRSAPTIARGLSFGPC